MGLIVLGYQLHLLILQRCHTACGLKGYSYLIPGSRLSNFYCDTSSALSPLVNR